MVILEVSYMLINNRFSRLFNANTISVVKEQRLIYFHNGKYQDY